MAYGIINHFPDGTQEQYENVVKVVHPDEGASLPEGQTFHIAGATDDGGWVVIALWDEKASWERFRDETLMPGLESVSDGFSGPPEHTGYEVRRQRSA
jgi:hypothetical protein